VPQHQLRHLPAVDGQIVDVAFPDVHADMRRAQIEHRRRADDGNCFRHTGRLELEIEIQLLADGDRHRGVFDGSESVLLGANRVGRRLERTREEVALLVAQHGALLTCPFVLHLHRGAGHERVRLIADGSREAPLIGLGEHRCGACRNQEECHQPLAKSHHASHGPADAGRWFNWGSVWRRCDARVSDALQAG
jgi:hypothetical protein